MMSVSRLRRAVTLGKMIIATRTSGRNLCTSTASTSGSDWTYRTPPKPPPRSSVIIAECLGGFVWWWVLWHVWTEPEHIYGAFRVVDPKLWTDEELGIPPDDED